MEQQRAALAAAAEKRQQQATEAAQQQQQQQQQQAAQQQQQQHAAQQQQPAPGGKVSFGWNRNHSSKNKVAAYLPLSLESFSSKNSSPSKNKIHYPPGFDLGETSEEASRETPDGGFAAAVGPAIRPQDETSRTEEQAPQQQQQQQPSATVRQSPLQPRPIRDSDDSDSVRDKRFYDAQEEEFWRTTAAEVSPLRLEGLKQQALLAEQEMQACDSDVSDNESSSNNNGKKGMLCS